MNQKFIYASGYQNVNQKGIIQIAHGMTEHAGVYTDFIDALLEAGYGVYAHDHKGHGKTVKKRRRLWSF